MCQDADRRVKHITPTLLSSRRKVVVASLYQLVPPQVLSLAMLHREEMGLFRVKGLRGTDLECSFRMQLLIIFIHYKKAGRLHKP